MALARPLYIIPVPKVESFMLIRKSRLKGASNGTAPRPIIFPRLTLTDTSCDKIDRRYSCHAENGNVGIPT